LTAAFFTVAFFAAEVFADVLFTDAFFAGVVGRRGLDDVLEVVALGIVPP
jgi:hypothetical protein